MLEIAKCTVVSLTTMDCNKHSIASVATECVAIAIDMLLNTQQYS